MKNFFGKTLLFLFILSITASCQKTYCPAYSSATKNPAQKTAAMDFKHKAK